MLTNSKLVITINLYHGKSLRINFSFHASLLNALYYKKPKTNSLNVINVDNKPVI